MQIYEPPEGVREIVEPAVGRLRQGSPAVSPPMSTPMRSPSRASRPTRSLRGATSRSVLIAILALAVLAFVGHRLLNPVYEQCAACEHTGRLSCGAEGCVHGSVSCPGHCIKADDPGWARMAVDGHPPDEEWLRFDNVDGSYAAWTRQHVGEAIEMVNGHYVNQGRCPLCAGTTRVACSTCNAARMCPTCRGRGQLRRWFSLQ